MTSFIVSSRMIMMMMMTITTTISTSCKGYPRRSGTVRSANDSSTALVTPVHQFHHIHRPVSRRWPQQQGTALLCRLAMCTSPAHHHQQQTLSSGFTSALLVRLSRVPVQHFRMHFICSMVPL
jgi:hypothetical protein